MSKISAHVRAQVTVEFTVGTWGGATSFNELHQICSREALATIQSKMRDIGLEITGAPVILVSTFKENT